MLNAADADILAAVASGEEVYRAVIDALAEGIVLQRRDGTIVASNASALRILQMTSDELNGRTSLDPEWRAVMQTGEPFPGDQHPSMVTLRTGEARSNVVMGVRRGKNEPTWISINTRPLVRLGASHPHAVVCSFFDITEAKNLELQLRQSEDQYRSLFMHSMDGVLLTRPDGSILAANDAACRMLGRSESEIVAVGRDGIVDVTDPRVAAAIEERKRSGQVSAELTFLRADGSKFPVEVTSVVFTDSTGELRTSMLFRDISERIRLDKMKTEFISTVSHELRTPLASIRGVLGLLQGGLLGTLPEEARQYVGIATNGADHLTRLLNDILDASKLESGQFAIEPVFADPNTVIKDAVELGRGLAAPAAIELRVESTVTAPVFLDPSRIVQVLTNLLSNAIKFSPSGALVTLVVCSQGSGRLRFEVTDVGLGIADQDVSRLFQRFVQVDSSDRRRRGGTGLGLAISRAIVLAHGGDMGVKSKLGAGSTFWFELPA